MYPVTRTGTSVWLKVGLAGLLLVLSWQILKTDPAAWQTAMARMLSASAKPAAVVTLMVGVTLGCAALHGLRLWRDWRVRMREQDELELRVGKAASRRCAIAAVRKQFRRAGIDPRAAAAGTQFMYRRFLPIEHGLARIENLATGLGFLGTVLGLMLMGSGADSAAAIQAGIATAVQTTAAGLVIAVPAGYCRGRVTECIERGASVLNGALARRPRGASRRRTSSLAASPTRTLPAGFVVTHPFLDT